MKTLARTSLTGFLICLSLLTVVAQQRPGAKANAAKAKAEEQDQEQERKAASLFESGQTAHQQGDLERAVELYSAALKLDPELWQAEFQRGMAWNSLNKLSAAKESMTRVLELLKPVPDSADLRQVSSRVYGVLGQIAITENNALDAEAAFRRAVELNPHAVRAHAGLAELLLKAAKTNEALVEAKAAIADGDDTAPAYALLGEIQARGGAFEEAIGSFSEALKRDPKNSFALRQRAELLIARNKFSEAIADLRAALAVEPLDQTKMRLAGLYVQAKKFEEAASIYQEALNADPSNIEARAALAAIMIDSGKGKDAIAQLESLIQANPNRADLHAQLAELYLPTQPEKSLEHYTAAAKLQPAQPAHQIGMASALVKLRRFEEAVTILNQTLAQNPKDDVAYYAHTNLGVALFELKDYQNAAREFIRILDYQRNRGDQKRASVTLYFLGICLDRLGDLEQALKAYEQFLSLASSDNQLEIDKVKLRLPSIQRQIKEGKGKRKQ